MARRTAVPTARRRVREAAAMSVLGLRVGMLRTRARPSDAHPVWEASALKIQGCAATQGRGCQSHYRHYLGGSGDTYEVRHSRGCTSRAGNCGWRRLGLLRIKNGSDVMYAADHSGHEAGPAGRPVDREAPHRRAERHRHGTTSRRIPRRSARFSLARICCRHRSGRCARPQRLRIGGGRGAPGGQR